MEWAADRPCRSQCGVWLSLDRRAVSTMGVAIGQRLLAVIECTEWPGLSSAQAEKSCL